MVDANDRGDEGGFVERALERLLPDLIARSVATGVKSVITSREGIRRVAESLPKEFAGFLNEQMTEMRDDVFRVLSTELRAFFDRVNLGQEIQRVLTALTLQVTMEVRFLPNDKGGVKPEIKAKVSPKGPKKKKSPPKSPPKSD